MAAILDYATHMALLSPIERTASFDLAEKKLAEGYSAAAGARATELSDFVLGILSLPPEILPKIVAKDAEEERKKSFAASRERREREAENDLDGLAEK